MHVIASAAAIEEALIDGGRGFVLRKAERLGRDAMGIAGTSRIVDPESSCTPLVSERSAGSR